MSYQPPGPYPIFPGQAGPMGPPPKPPIPPSVQRAFVLMLVGAGLEILNIILSFMFAHQITEKVDQALNTGQTMTDNSASAISGAVGGIIGIGLWLWMAFANRAGHNWARITGTVFFGISCLGVLGNIAAYALASQVLGTTGVALIVENTVGWLVGLATVILLWKKESSAFFQPPMGMYPGWAPGPGYMPGAPMQGGNYQQQEPKDPWATPGGQG